MKRLTPALAALTIALTACGGTPDLYPVTPPPVTETIPLGFAAVEVRNISLPTYAAASEIAVEDATGRLLTNSGTLWADDPERAIALELAGHLARMSRAKVATEPWPFEAFPDARLDLRFERLIAGADGQFRANGQYFVGVADGGRERSGLFDLSVPFDPAGGPPAIAKARGQLIHDLAIEVARNGLR